MVNFRKSTLAIVSGILMFTLTIAACNSQEKKEDSTTVKPADTVPAADTIRMDTATTRPVKGGN
ncbi:MAG: hypothetical protein IT249_20545 [Chitinophagaceae bacterium]|nr:hypothetical protein [Chitinophagaceae bacterium]